MSTEKITKKSVQAAASAPAQDATKKKGARPTNTDPAKQPGFAAQEAALKPPGGNADKITDCQIVVTEIRKSEKGRSEADLTCNYLTKGSSKPVRSEKRTVKFAWRVDDTLTADNIWKAFAAGGHLEAAGIPQENLSEIGSDGFLACLMAVRDQHIVKGTDVGAPKAG